MITEEDIAEWLAYALIFLQDQTEESWPTILFEGDKPMEHFVFITQLRELCFPAKTGSSRFLRKPVTELAAISDIFDKLEISKNGRSLTWKFTEGFFHIMSDMDIYALINASEIGHCQRKFDGALLSQIALHRKKRVPEFRLIGPNKDFECGSMAVMPSLIPGEIKRQLRPSLQNWSDKSREYVLDGRTTFRPFCVALASRIPRNDVINDNQLLSVTAGDKRAY